MVKLDNSDIGKGKLLLGFTFGGVATTSLGTGGLPPLINPLIDELNSLNDTKAHGIVEDPDGIFFLGPGHEMFIVILAAIANIVVIADILARYFSRGKARDIPATIEFRDESIEINGLSKGAIKEILRSYVKTSQKRPEKLRSIHWAQKGYILMSKEIGEYERAVECYDKRLRIDPEDATSWHNKGYALHKLGKLEDAIMCLDKAIELNPENDNTWFSKSYVLMELQKYKEARECLDKTLKINPQLAVAWFNKACAEAQLRNTKAAVSSLKKAIELDSTFKESAKKDMDLDSIREDRRFRDILLQ